MAHGVRNLASELSGTFAKSYGHAHGPSVAANLSRLRDDQTVIVFSCLSIALWGTYYFRNIRDFWSKEGLKNRTDYFYDEIAPVYGETRDERIIWEVNESKNSEYSVWKNPKVYRMPPFLMEGLIFRMDKNFTLEKVAMIDKARYFLKSIDNAIWTRPITSISVADQLEIIGAVDRQGNLVPELRGKIAWPPAGYFDREQTNVQEEPLVQEVQQQQE